MKVLLIALLIAPVISDPLFVRGRRWDEFGLLGRLKRHHSDPPPAPAQWFTQQLDHFDPSNTATWKQVKLSDTVTS